MTTAKEQSARSRGDTAHRLAAAAVIVGVWVYQGDMPPGVEAAMVTLVAFPLGLWLRKDRSARAAARAALKEHSPPVE